MTVTVFIKLQYNCIIVPLFLKNYRDAVKNSGYRKMQPSTLSHDFFTSTQASPPPPLMAEDALDGMASKVRP